MSDLREDIKGKMLELGFWLSSESQDEEFRVLEFHRRGNNGVTVKIKEISGD